MCRRLAVIFVVLIAGDHVSAKLLQHRYFDDQLHYAAFELQNGTVYTPESLAQLEEMLPSIQHILSIGFLLWVEFEEDLRYDILELVKEFDVTGTSSDLVEKLFELHESESKLRDINNLLASIDSGEIIDQVYNHEIERNWLSLSKSIIRNSLHKYGKTRISFEELTDHCDVTDFMDGIFQSDESSATQLGALMLSSQCIKSSLGDTILFFPDWSDALAVASFIANVLATITAVAGFVEALRGLAIELIIKQIFGPGFKLITTGVAKALGAVGVALTIAVIVMDIVALVQGNLTGLETATHLTSIGLGIVGIILTISGFLSVVTAGVGAIIGLVGVLVAAIGWIISEILGAINKNKKAEKHVLRLDRIMPLTDAEKKQEKQNYKDGKPVDEELGRLINQTAYNMALVGIQLDNLKEMTDFERFVFPAFDWTGMLYKDSKADLSGNKRKLHLQRWAPRSAVIDLTGSNGLSRIQNHIICAPESTSSTPNGWMEAWPCTNAIGITEFEYGSRTNNYTLFNLGNGTDTATGTTNYTNVFLIENGTKVYTGGDMNDVFVVQSGYVVGTLNGHGGNNTLDLRAENISATMSVTIDLPANLLRLGNNVVNLANLEIINGRENMSDTIIANCDVVLINGRGGGVAKSDIIEIPEENGCQHDLFIEANRKTSVSNGGVEGSFLYNFNQTFEADFRLNIAPGVNSSHFIKIEPGLESILNVTYLEGEFKMTSTLPGPVFTSNIVLRNESDQFYEPTVVLPDQIVIKVDSKQIVNTVFNIVNTTEQVRAPEFGQAMFFLQAHVGQIVGRSGNDTVFLGENATSQRISGGLGVNTLIINEDFWPNSVLQMNLDLETLRFNDAGGAKEMLVQSFTQILGRPGLAEEYTIACGEIMVDGRGGKNWDIPDRINLITKDCERTTLVRLNSYTSLSNLALQGNFIYFLSFSEAIAINLEFRPNLNHTFQFDFDLQDIYNASLTMSKYGGSRKLVLESLFNHTQLLLPVSNSTSESSYFDSPVFLTKDGVLLQASPQNIMAIHNISTNATESTVGADFADNMFFISTPLSGSIKGRSKSDTFFLSGGASNLQGNLYGGGGIDRIVLDKSYDPDSMEWIHMSDFQAIEEFVGKNSSVDKVRTNCETTLVDGLDGVGPSEPDEVEISHTANCPYDIVVVIRNFTSIRNSGAAGEFKYYIQTAGGYFPLNYDTGNHTIILPLRQDEISVVTFSNSTNRITISTWTSSYSFDVLLNTTTSAQVQPTLMLTEAILFNIQDATKSTNVTATFIVSQDQSTTEGFVFLENMFLIQGLDSPEVVGGGLDDTFIIGNETLKNAAIYGVAGTDTLLVSSDISSNYSIYMISHEAAAVDIVDYTDFDQGTPHAFFSNISNIIGRKGSADIIYIDCNVHVIDCAGGGSAAEDWIVVPDLPCNYSTTIAINNHTTVISSAKTGSFFYTIPESGLDQFYIDCDDCVTNTTQHVMVVKFNAQDIKNVTLGLDCIVELRASFEQPPLFTYGYRFAQTEANTTCAYPKLIFPDTFVLDISYIGVIHGQFKGNDSNIVELMDTYLARASDLNATIIVLTGNDEEFINIGREDFDMLQSSPSHMSHLIGNGGGNLYVINKVNHSIPDVRIYFNYTSAQNSSLEIFDFTQLSHPIRSRENNYYLPDISIDPDTEDLVLTFMERGIQVAKIFLSGWEWLLTGGIFLFGDMYMTLGEDEEGILRFEPIPNNFTNETAIILDVLEFEEGATLSFPERILPADKSVLRQGNDMVLTNFFDLEDVEREESKGEEKYFILFKSFMETATNGGKIGARSIPTNITLSFSNLDISMDTVTSDYVIEEIDAVKEEWFYEIEKQVFAFKCLDEGLFSDPKDCSHYYRCAKVGAEFIAISLPCPTGTIFCSEKRNCQVESVECPCNQVVWKLGSNEIKIEL